MNLIYRDNVEGHLLVPNSFEKLETLLKQFKLRNGPLADVKFINKFQRVYFIGLRRYNVSMKLNFVQIFTHK